MIKSNRRTCTACGKDKPMVAFAGNQATCKKCHSKKNGKAPARKKNLMSKSTLKRSMARANGHCEVCGKASSNLERHHKNPVCLGGAPNDLHNLVVACHSCHCKMHTGEMSHYNLAKRAEKMRRVAA